MKTTDKEKEVMELTLQLRDAMKGLETKEERRRVAFQLATTVTELNMLYQMPYRLQLKYYVVFQRLYCFLFAHGQLGRNEGGFMRDVLDVINRALLLAQYEDD